MFSQPQLLTRMLARIGTPTDLPLRLALWNGLRHDLGADPVVTVHLPSPKALQYFLPPSLDNLAEGYVNGHFDVQGRVQDVVTAASRLAHSSVPLRGKMARIFNPLHHNRAMDARAIEHHYDVSNDFYRLWLDEKMVYSCAYFPTGAETLEMAQDAKLDHILTKLMLKPGERLLDIGCGWGALAIRAAQKYGAQVVGITLSKSQHALALERVARADLSHQVEIRLQDYRDVNERAEQFPESVTPNYLANNCV
jgi:cyclopropane-fatty-acyl-phospholipid synthase